uniref:RNA-directed DNA polymerase n=1 Tax=Strongyloides stercoralis TaxID=6248 RepID=A0AAF5DKL1_STRER
MAIMKYDLTIQYIKGEENKVADYLSREQFMVVNVKKDLMSDAFSEMDTEYSQPYDTEKFEKYLNEEEETQRTDKEERIKTLYGSRIYVLEVLKEHLLIRFYNHPILRNHMNLKKIEKKFKEIFYWPKMEKDMIQIQTSFDTCVRNKKQLTRLVKTKIRNLQIPLKSGYTLNADFMQIGKEYILVIVDEYSKFICASINKKQNRTRLKKDL